MTRNWDSRRTDVCRKRFKRIAYFVLFLSVLVTGKYFYLQIYRGTEMCEQAKGMSQYNAPVHHPRGKIVDRDGVELAVSMVTGSLYADPEKMIDKETYKNKPGRNVKREAARLLAPVLKMHADKLYAMFNVPGSRFQWIKRMLEPREEEAVRKIIRENRLPGLDFKRESKRFYTKKKMAAQVLGFVGTEDKGGSGIEYYLDKELKSRTTKQIRSYDGHDKRIYDEHVKDGVELQVPTVELTLDSHMQYVLEQALDTAIAAYRANGAAALIMDPHTGEILSMVSRPTFDPNTYYEYSPESWSNKCITMMYEPGSVFKPIVGCIGMKKKVVGPDTGFNDLGSIRIADRVFHNWDGQGAGYITFTDVIKNSVNTGMIELGTRIGKKSMVQGAKDFGFGAVTGVDLPGEAEGILYEEGMYDPDLASFSIGQGIAVTPIQELRAICAIANGGKLLKPYIIKKITDADGNVVTEGRPQIVDEVISEDIALKMRRMMEKVVSEGGGKKAAITGYRIAGKTGTAEKKAENGGYAAGEYIASFVGFVPADKPRYAMLVLVDTPQGSRFYGSQVAAPIFRDVLQQILVLKGIEPSEKEGLITLESANGRSQAAGAKLPEFKVLEDGNVLLPEIKNVGIGQTMEILEKVKLRLRPYGSGRAYLQNPPEGTRVKPGTVIEIWYR